MEFIIRFILLRWLRVDLNFKGSTGTRDQNQPSRGDHFSHWIYCSYFISIKYLLYTQHCWGHSVAQTLPYIPGGQKLMVSFCGLQNPLTPIVLSLSVEVVGMQRVQQSKVNRRNREVTALGQAWRKAGLSLRPGSAFTKWCFSNRALLDTCLGKGN